MIRFILIVTLQTCLTLIVSGQNAREEIIKINSNFNNESLISGNVKFMSFDNHITNVSSDQFEGNFRKKGKDFILTIGKIVNAGNSRLSITTDPEEDILIISDPTKNYSMAFTYLDSLLKMAGNVNVQKAGNESRKIVIKIQEESALDVLDKIEIWYSSSNYYLNRICFYYRNEIPDENNDQKMIKPRVEYRYENWKFDSDSKEKAFALSDFFTTKGKEFIPSLKYKHYQILDQRIKK